ncbi:ABC transporter ATP-binding protein [Leptolyngbya sp. FACHB-261]|uniref:ABC transporter ATP-binding protein n=1 Tax=Leptolyngbya sp. FACHB-261 TaxID=2692806 RepID=UPI0016863C67|nr:ABC transporter ATP-binding protein [Leptolyngbya sp. FACHB-261]MBD2103686.1 ABC transporter ATP-binding protein [Leptolyngbya sp. FACHB-261]
MSDIRFDQVSLRFPGAPRPAVDQCSLEVEAGRFVVILGPSGCGKTTLLKMVNRLYEPTSGKITIDGTDIRQLKVTALRRQIGYVIQQSGLFPHMTVAQNVAVVPKLLGWERSRVQPRIDELLELVDLPPQEYRNRYPAQLSGGQQQRVGLARALAGDPSVLLMDEPFGAIDAITRTTLQDEILRLQRQLQKTILFVSHDVEEALRLADRLLILQRGQIVQYDTPFNILTRPANAFVRELVGADDMVRQLSLLRVETAMKSIPQGYTPNGEPTIAQHENLRQALSLLLQTGAPALTVLDNRGAVGLLTLEHIRDSASLGANV